MSSLHTHILLNTFFAIGCALLAYGLGGWYWAQSALMFYLLGWLIYHLYHLNQFQQRLPRNIPKNQQHTFWSQLIADFERHSRSTSRHRDLLRQALIRFQAAAEALPNGILMVNRDGRIEWLNHTALSHLQLNPQNALGSPIKKQLSNQHHQALFEQTQNQQEIRVSLPQSNGMERHFRIVRIPFAQQSQLIISEDISRAEQLNATRTAFIANVSHELRTPLTVIDGFLETLADYPDLPNEQQQQFIELMQNESQRMLNLISDLLTLSTLENPTAASIELNPINLSELCQQIAQAAENLSGSRHRIHTTLPENIIINASVRDLYQALSNLVFNAVRYTPEGGEIHISLTLQPNPNPYKPPQVRFAVQDNGVGIAAEHLPHLTDRFYRVDKGRSRESGGTGLGLAIAKHALAHHDAILEIKSELGKGSEFAAVFQTLPENTSTKLM